MIFFQLFYEFFITGLFSFGGGLATIPFLQQMSERTAWFTLQELMDMVAVAEATPGPIGVNMATYAGFTTAGILGGVIAVLGILIPSVFLATVAVRILSKFKGNSIVESAFYGLRPASLGLIAFAGLSVLKLSLLNGEFPGMGDISLDLFNINALVLAGILFLLTNKFKAHPIIFLAASAVAGVIFEL